MLKLYTAYKKNNYDNKMACTARATKRQPVCAGIVIRDNNNRYLLVFGKEAGKWSFPKGHIEEHESWKACAKRETMEESGLDVTIPEKVKHCFTRKSVYFLLRQSSVNGTLTPNPQDSREIGNAAWMDKKTLTEMSRDMVNSDVWEFIKALKWYF
jgi:ADP-ribose pyrophosphatase YjhB (NUDIX family)